MDLGRGLGALSLGLTGIGLNAIALRRLVLGVPTTVGLVVVVATLLVGIAFAVGGVVVHRSSLDSGHVARVGSWNALGVVATSGVLGLIGAFQAATGGVITTPLLAGALVVGVSGFAHVLIGLTDVRRIRAETVAKQRRKAAVVNRVVRHDLKHAAQLLFGYADVLESTGDGPGTDDDGVDRKLRDLGGRLADTHERIEIVDDLLEADATGTTVDLHEIVARHESEWREAYPDASFDVDVPTGLTAAANPHVETALVEVVENAFEYGGDPPAVTIRVTETKERVRFDVLDDGDGIPERERSLLDDERMESQLDHSSGLGLWLSKWIVDRSDGTLSVEPEPNDAGTRVVVDLPTAR